MDLWLMKALTKLIRKRYALFKTLVIAVLVLSLAACGGKAVSQDTSIQLAEKPVRELNAKLSNKISEVAPPEVIQELRQSIEKYQPQVKILSPQPDEILESDKVKVNLQVKDLPIFKDSQYELGSHLEVILDNQPEIAIYDLNQPLELSDLSPGTHTLRVFATRPWDESFKNEGAYTQTTFHIFTKSDDNNPDSKLPVLTYNSPEGIYGAEPILLDFYLTNAPLHILAKDNPGNPIADWRVRCIINGESFILDRWQSVYLKGFNQGKNWVKLEFLDNQGNPVKNVYNSTVKVINYEPEGKDTLAKIVRGELSAEELRGIVDADYAVKTVTEENPEIQLEENPDKGGFFDRFKRNQQEKEDRIVIPQPRVEAVPEIIEIPRPEIINPETELEETIPEVTETTEAETELEETIPEVIKTPETEDKLEDKIPEVIKTPETETKGEKPEETKLDGFLNRFKRNKEDKTPIPQPRVEATPEIIEIPQSESNLEETIPEVIETPQPEIIKPENGLEETIPEVIDNSQPKINQEEPEEEAKPIPQSAKAKLDGFLNRFKRDKEDEISIPQPEIIDSPTTEVEPNPELPPTLPEIVEPSENETPIIQQDIPVPENQVEIKPIPEQTPETTVPEIPANTTIVR